MAKKKIAVIIDTVKEQEKTLWQKIKDWFYHSEVVALAWITTAFGTITGLVGVMDFAPLWALFQTGTTFTNKQLLWIGAGIAGLGISTYLARIHGTKEVDGRLLPKAN